MSLSRQLPVSLPAVQAGRVCADCLVEGLRGSKAGDVRPVSSERFCRGDLLDTVGEELDILTELRDIFGGESTRLLGDVHVGLASKDANKVRIGAHTLKTVVANVGGRASRDLAAAIEEAARAPQPDFDMMNTLYGDLTREVEALAVAFNTYVTELAKGAA